MRCSQLSSTSTQSRSPRSRPAGPTASRAPIGTGRSISVESRSPSAPSTTCGTSAGSVTGASSASQTPSPAVSTSRRDRLVGQPGLAGAARADQRDQPAFAEQLADAADLLVATDEAGQLGPQVAAGRDGTRSSGSVDLGDGRPTVGRRRCGAARRAAAPGGRPAAPATDRCRARRPASAGSARSRPAPRATGRRRRGPDQQHVSRSRNGCAATSRSSSAMSSPATQREVGLDPVGVRVEVLLVEPGDQRRVASIAASTASPRHRASAVAQGRAASPRGRPAAVVAPRASRSNRCRSMSSASITSR